MLWCNNVMVSHFKYKLAAIYILYGVCTQTSVLIYAVGMDLVQPKHVQGIVSGGTVYSVLYTVVEQKQYRETKQQT